MFYYAYIDANYYVTGVYALPSAISADGYISITEEQYSSGDLVGKVYDPETNTFNEPNSWVCNTDLIQYKETNNTLTEKLDAMDSDITSKANTSDIHNHDNKTVLDGITAEKVALWNSGTAGEDGTTVVVGTTTTGDAGTNASVTGSLNEETNTLTLNFTIPKGADGESGSSASITAEEVLNKIKSVDGSNSGLDADTLDGMEATAFAAAAHTHDYAPISHTHTGYATEASVTALEATVAGKADGTHNHDTAYSALNHTHDNYALATALDGKANTDHTHTGYAAADHTHTEYAASEHTHTGYAAADHTHTGYASATAVSALETTVAGKADSSHNHDNDYAAADHTHAQSEITGLSTALNGKAESSHTHAQSEITGLASALNGKSDTSHTHSGYASSSHTHSGYASSSHTHTSFSSAVDVAGAIKSNGVQVGYNSGSITTLGSNNYPTIVAGTQVTLNGEKAYAPNIYPRDTGDFTLGAYSNRWTNIYSKNAVNVSSDRRLKENIENINADEAVKLIKDIDVVNFNYIGDDKPQIGIIAQDIIEKAPELSKAIVEQGDNGYYGVKTSDLVFPLIVAVQQLAKRVEELEKAE